MFVAVTNPAKHIQVCIKKRVEWEKIGKRQRSEIQEEDK
jgi:hypothetical protein